MGTDESLSPSGAIEAARPRTRRALLSGALAGIGAWAAAALGRAAPVLATDGQAVIQGADNSGTQGTLIRTSAGTAFQGLADAASGTAYGVRGRTSSTAFESAGVLGVAGPSSGQIHGVFGATNSSAGAGVYGRAPASGDGHGVWGNSESFGTGVWGTSAAGNGVEATSVTGYGLLAHSDSGIGAVVTSFSATEAGLFARSDGGVGVFGAGGASDPGDVPTHTGVAGFSGFSTGIGVHGESPTGHAVHGVTQSGYAGYFAGKVYTTKWYELKEISTPSAPGSNRARLFIRDNGSGHTQLCVRFANGKTKVVANDV